ncbi:MAG: sigma-70 family RNA polymerase sigma factor [Verrucomicrobia bacterium]|nr:sigma-70 family RNA polymerase sigma factor [Verrucomicrobiota bacterium]
MRNKVEDWIPTRQSLLSRLRNWDDRASWEDFFNTYSKLIYNVARQSGLTEAEAQDVVQETVITVAKQMPEFKYDPSKGSFKGWLLKTAQWRINDQFRKRQPCVPLRAEPQTDREGMPAGESGPAPEAFRLDEQWDELWKENLLEAALERVRERVDPKEFQMFDLMVRRECPPLKVAQRLDVTRAHVYYAKYKIARMLRQEVERMEKGR